MKSAACFPRTGTGKYPHRLFVRAIAGGVCMLLCCAGTLAAQTEQTWWYTLERGKQLFRNGDYGDALLAFEDARRQRRTVFERMERNLIDVLSIGEVRRLGNSLDWVERYIAERHYAAAGEALAELYYRVPKESLNNSPAAALAALGALKDYPEAEYWIGETYRLEGEMGLALKQFQKAYELRSLFENSGFGVELLYKTAAIRKSLREYNEMERTLLSLLAADTLWSGASPGADTRGESSAGASQTGASTTGASPTGLVPAGVSPSFARQAMTRTLENEGVDRFLTLYRYNNTLTEEAHRLLGFYYSASGRHSRAQEHLMFSFLIQNTTIIEEIMRRQYDLLGEDSGRTDHFSVRMLELLAPYLNRGVLLPAYTEQVEYYKTIYYLALSLFGNGKPAAAASLWLFLSGQSGAGEWQRRAQGQFQNPHIERAIEMP